MSTGTRLALLPQPESPVALHPDLVRTLVVAREADRREGILFRQGRGWFQLPTSGHEPMAVFAEFLHQDDYKFLYYRDRALLLALGWSAYDIALEYFAGEGSSSGGRQMPSFASDRTRNIVTMAPPTGLQYLPAAGCAWACKLRGDGQAVLCTTGEAATREGEFYEALCFATEHALPIVFAVEDNGWGISTPTGATNPLSLGVLSTERCIHVNGRDIGTLRENTASALNAARSGGGPVVLWIHFDRLGSHSASDDQRQYRSREELSRIAGRDFMAEMMADSEFTRDEIDTYVAVNYEKAEKAAASIPASACGNVFGSAALPHRSHGLPARPTWTMAAAIQQTLNTLLSQNPRVLMFGQDIEDAKGGVFGVSKGLSSAYPGRVINAPLAEATIAGTASGLSLAGYLPIFELQFIDFAGPAFNQIVNQIATVRWRSRGAWTNPLILLAPCGGYLRGSGPWHSQSNEGWFAHAPGLQVVIPSTPGDAAALLHAAAAGEDPVLFLIPKHLLRAASEVRDETPIRLGQAVIRSAGTDVTLVAWGNCVPLSLVAAEALAQRGISAEVIDLRTLVPCDWETIQCSLEKTGRLIVVQEDNRTCSFGQSIISEVVSRPEMWRLLASRPELISRPDSHIGFHPELEAAVLPSSSDIVAAAERCLFPQQAAKRPAQRDWMFAAPHVVRETGGKHGASGDEC